MRPSELKDGETIQPEAARELSTEDVTNLGDFLITTAEMLLELEELEVQTRDALARLRAELAA